MIAGLINKRNLVLHITQALIWATFWLILLWTNEYPLNEWVGVAALGYLAWYAANALVSNTARFVLVRVHRYATRVYDKPDAQAPVSKGTHWTVMLIVDVFIYGLAIVTSGFMFILTWLSMDVLGFPPIDMNIIAVGLIAVTLGLSMALPLAVVYVLALARPRLKVQEGFERVSALARDMMTKERLIPNWVFGLNLQRM